MATLTIDEPMANALRAKAAACGVPVEELLRQVATEPDPKTVPQPQLSVDEFKRVLRMLAAESAHLPVLPADFSREDIYFDHD